MMAREHGRERSGALVCIWNERGSVLKVTICDSELLKKITLWLLMTVFVFYGVTPRDEVITPGPILALRFSWDLEMRQFVSNLWLFFLNLGHTYFKRQADGSLSPTSPVSLEDRTEIA